MRGFLNTQDQLEIATLGTEFALAEIIGAGIGWWLDTKLNTLPWCLIGGVCVGFTVGLVRIIQAAKGSGRHKEGKKNGHC